MVLCELPAFIPWQKHQFSQPPTEHHIFIGAYGSCWEVPAPQWGPRCKNGHTEEGEKNNLILPASCHAAWNKPNTEIQILYVESYYM